MLVTSGAPGPPDTWRVVPTGAAHRAAGRGTTLVTVLAPDGHSAEAERPRACLWRPHVPTQTVPDAQRGLRRPHPGMIGPTLGRVCALSLPARRCTTLLPSRGRLGRGPRGLVPAGRFLRGCCGTTSPPSHGDRGHGGPRGTHLPALSSVRSTALDSVSLRVKPLWSRGCASSRTDKSRFPPV